MRLICPNCGAQYAVDSRVIPEAGRDVQCSNCGNTWFQTHPEKSPEPIAEPEIIPRGAPIHAPGIAERPVPEPGPEPEIAARAEPSPEPDIAPPTEPVPGPDLEWREPDTAPTQATGMPVQEPVEEPAPTPFVEQEPAEETSPPVVDAPLGTTPEDSRPADSAPVASPLPEVSAYREPSEPDPEATDARFADLSDHLDASDGQEEQDEDPDDLMEAERPPVERPRRPVDDSVLAVLKEEAAREAAARKAESGGLETQGELNMEMPEKAFSPPPPFGRDPARVIPSDTLSPEEPPRPHRVPPRRDLLPDIEEINSTLKPEDRPAPEPVETAAAREERNRGRRYGLSLAFFLAGFLVLLYSQAPRVADAVPQAAPALKNYVATVNSGRLWLDQTLRDAVDAVQGAEG